ncbi:UNVERIFIED_CONTAM: Retrovirus-related Pol polyprotein from transposon.6 [Sesamum calycinum]|uniref:Retrovirus-related Pol polyprotein from transposon.6 n=1 Tax=Sesamum calycinum TaxID=2727403 RepID=A0AAW2P893_9LAMI
MTQPPLAISKIQSSYARDCHDSSSQRTNSRTIGTGNPSLMLDLECSRRPLGVGFLAAKLMRRPNPRVNLSICGHFVVILNPRSISVENQSRNMQGAFSQKAYHLLAKCGYDFFVGPIKVKQHVARKPDDSSGNSNEEEIEIIIGTNHVSIDEGSTRTFPKELNLGTIEESHPIFVSALLSLEEEEQYFKTLGTTKSECRPKTKNARPFAPLKRIYCYKVMPFRLKNAGATYQRAMPNIVDDMLHKKVESYVDDLVVKIKKRGEHLADLQIVFDRLRNYNLKMNLPKCAFGVSFEKFLGFIVRHRGIEVDPTKVDAIEKMPPP